MTAPFYFKVPDRQAQSLLDSGTSRSQPGLDSASLFPRTKKRSLGQGPLRT